MPVQEKVWSPSEVLSWSLFALVKIVEDMALGQVWRQRFRQRGQREKDSIFFHRMAGDDQCIVYYNRLCQLVREVDPDITGI